MKFISEVLLVITTEYNKIIQTLFSSTQANILQNNVELESVLSLKNHFIAFIDKEKELYTQSLTLMDSDKLVGLTEALSDFGVKTFKSDGEDIFLDFLLEKKTHIGELENIIVNLELLHAGFLSTKFYIELSNTTLINIQKQISVASC